MHLLSLRPDLQSHSNRRRRPARPGWLRVGAEIGLPVLPAPVLLTIALLALALPVAAQRPRMVSDEVPALVVKAPAGTIVWIDNLRYGKAGEDGAVRVKTLKPGSHLLRARLKGKREMTRTFRYTGAAGEEIEVKFTAPASPAELHFQTAEELRESGKHREAIGEYRRALALSRGGYAAARIGLARSLMATEKYDDAVAEARRALRDGGGRSAEAYTVLGNTRRFQGLSDEALTNYETALALSRNTSVEAHTGMALTYQDRNRPEEAIKHYRLALAHANDTEPIVYMLLGTTLEREYRNEEALEVYEKYLQLLPQGRQANAIRSIIKQLRRTVQ